MTAGAPTVGARNESRPTMQKALFLFAVSTLLAAAPAARAASGVIELEIPGMNPVTAAAIADFRTNSCPATLAALRASIATNYDGVVARKIDKLHELERTAHDQYLVDEMQEIVDDMVEFKWQRVEQNVVRFADPRFGRRHDGDYRYNEPDADGFIPLLGADSDVSIGYTHVTNAAYALFDPSHAFPAGEEGHPVTGVSYSNAVAYCAWLTENSPDYAWKYRLPTEAEWELASGHMPKDACINAANVETGTTDVYHYYNIYTNGAQSLSGCLDMWGNAWEWLATPGEAAGTMKIKGGAWDESRAQCRTEERGNWRDASQGFPNVGLRLVRTANRAADVIRDANSAAWLQRSFGRTFELADWAELEKDHDGDGVPSYAEYAPLTDPNDPDSRFLATIAFDAGGAPAVGWNVPTLASRAYAVEGKENLSDSVWISVGERTALYRFFRVVVRVR